MGCCECFQSMLSVAGDAELHETWGCLSLELPTSKVPGIMATMKLSEYSRVDCSCRQQFCTIILLSFRLSMMMDLWSCIAAD